MDEGDRDPTNAALARVTELERENADMRTRIAALERRLALVGDGVTRSARYRGPLVVLGVMVVMGSMLGAALFMSFQMHRPASERRVPIQASEPARP